LFKFLGPLLIATLSFYLVMEVSVTTWFWLAWKDVSIWIFEDSGRTIEFDSVRGYRLTTIPSRWARITQGEVEYVGTLHGNQQGYPSKFEAAPARSSGTEQRIAVFGDSFTSAQFIDMSWPDRTRDLLRMRGHNFELLNFSTDGGGLGNWWSNIENYVRPYNYDLDVILFAVFADDLERTFSFSDHRQVRHHMFGRWPSWKPGEWPKDLPTARTQLRPVPDSHIVSTHDFDDFLNKRWPLSVSQPPIRPVIAKRAYHLLKSLLSRQPSDKGRPNLINANSPQRPLMRDILSFIEEKGLLALVVYVPSKEALLQSPETGVAEYRAVQSFADALNSRVLDGRLAFSDLNKHQLGSYFFKYDAHWNQKGSDRFAEWISQELSRANGLTPVDAPTSEGHLRP
jgi:hypothetical protein